MDSSSLVAAIDIALDKLLYLRKQSTASSERMELGIIMHWLCAVRTFCFCSTTLAYNVELRAEGNSDNVVISLRSQKKKMKQKRSKMRKWLGSLLVRVEYVVCRILDINSPLQCDFGYEMGSCDEEMDEWYATWSVFLKKYSTSHVANQIKAIEESVFENFKDFPSIRAGHDLRQIEALKKKITVMRKIICFGTLLCTENQDFQCPLTQIEPLAISAAHIAHRIFSNMEGPIDLSNGLTRYMLSALLLKFNPPLHEKDTPALPSLRHSGELYDPTLDLSDYPFIMKMEHCIDSLSSTLSEMLQLGAMVSLKDLLLYERLTLLRILLKREPDRFNDDVKIRNLIAAIVCDAGVRIFSFYQKDLVNDHWIQCVLENSEGIWEDVLEEKVTETSAFNFPRTNVMGFLDFLLEDYLMEVNRSNVDSNTLSCVLKIEEHLVFLKSFMGKLMKLRIQQENLHQDVWNLAVHMAYKIEFLIDQLVLGDVLDSFSISLQSITEHIMILRAVSLKNDEGRQEISEVQKINWPSTDEVQSISSRPVADEVVGFESEKASIVNQLMAGFKKLQVVAIVGMAGLGKTTLATKVYRDSFVTRHFYVKAWCSISQVFDRRKVLLQLLNQIQPGESNWEMKEDEYLSLKLWRSLKKRRYLIFIDDVWDTEAFDLLKRSLPDDECHSRILLTSRHSDVVLGYIPHDQPVLLPLLTKEQSLELLRRKLFPDHKDWPSELHGLGMKIVEYCKGLPLTLVLIAGFLRTEDQEGWKDVLKTLRSSTIPDLTVRTLELSYAHLPDHLKPLFLWFGAYPEDHEIPLKNMIWLWISEDLIQKLDSKSPEEVAIGYIYILIARGLVMVAGRSSVGDVKTCRIHDLLRDFCLRKSNEELFLHVLNVNADKDGKELLLHELGLSSFYEPELLSFVALRNMRRLCIYSELALLQWEVFCSRLRSLLFFGATESYVKRDMDVTFIFRMFKFLRVLDVREFAPLGFPREIGGLAQLRYLAIKVLNFVAPEIGNLINLEILILSAELYIEAIELPDTIWNLRKLRHMCTIKGCSNKVGYKFPITNLDNSCNLVELESLSILCPGDWSIAKKLLKKFPNIRRLRLQIDVYGSVSNMKVVDFSFLNQLESLSYASSFPGNLVVVFPESIIKLTLGRCEFPWSQMSSIAKLPRLAVLKLLQDSFNGETWNLEEDEEFPNLKFLNLEFLNIRRWTAASNDQFPRLEKLVLNNCFSLQEIPEDCMGNVQTLKEIEVKKCRPSVVSQVRMIERTQKEYGTLLQIHMRDNFV